MGSAILHQTSWAKSVDGQNIELFHNTPLTNRNESILFIGGLHGDEPEGVQLSKDLLFWLQKSNNITTAWLLIPCLNVDGFSRGERVNSRGVDLNRNFPSDDWSPSHTAPRYFPGKHPSSEPETQSLVSLIKEVRPRLIIHFHSWQPCVVYTGKPGKKAAEIIQSSTEYPISEDIGYPTPGSLGQYAWFREKIPVICVEAQEGYPLDRLWDKFGSGLQKLFQSSIDKEKQ